LFNLIVIFSLVIHFQSPILCIGGFSDLNNDYSAGGGSGSGGGGMTVG
jgi:hypothetical protein